MPKPKRNVCGRLGQDQAFGPTDFCKLPAGHEGAHQGLYRNMVWEDVPNRPHRARIHRPGSLTGDMPATGGNIRGNR